MTFENLLLKLHGILEISAGVAMIVVTSQVFPFLADSSQEIQYLGKCFGVAIMALGLTALMSKRASGALLFGALSYHVSVTSLFVRQLINEIASEPAKTQIACGGHGTLALLFAFAWVSHVTAKKTKNE